jgi:hypothetical protein
MVVTMSTAAAATAPLTNADTLLNKYLTFEAKLLDIVPHCKHAGHAIKIEVPMRTTTPLPVPASALPRARLHRPDCRTCISLTSATADPTLITNQKERAQKLRQSLYSH